jgi:hypothetical protein
MSGHIMRMSYDPRWESVWLTVECHENGGAECHSVSGVCEAAEWFVDDVETQCASRVGFPMHDGMPITVKRDGEGWTWDTAGSVTRCSKEPA